MGISRDFIRAQSRALTLILIVYNEGRETVNTAVVKLYAFLGHLGFLRLNVQWSLLATLFASIVKKILRWTSLVTHRWWSMWAQVGQYKFLSLLSLSLSRFFIDSYVCSKFSKISDTTALKFFLLLNIDHSDADTPDSADRNCLFYCNNNNKISGIQTSDFSPRDIKILVKQDNIK